MVDSKGVVTAAGMAIHADRVPNEMPLSFSACALPVRRRRRAGNGFRVNMTRGNVGNDAILKAPRNSKART